MPAAGTNAAFDFADVGIIRRQLCKQVTPILPTRVETRKRSPQDTSTTPRDAEWGERYFHLTDPDGHELSFARPLAKAA